MDHKLLGRSSIWDYAHATPNPLHGMVWDLSVFNLNFFPNKELNSLHSSTFLRELGLFLHFANGCWEPVLSNVRPEP